MYLYGQPVGGVDEFYHYPKVGGVGVDAEIVAERDAGVWAVYYCVVALGVYRKLSKPRQGFPVKRYAVVFYKSAAALDYLFAGRVEPKRIFSFQELDLRTFSL